MDYGMVAERLTNLNWADEIILSAIEDNAPMDIGSKLFVMRAVRDGLELSCNDRPQRMNDLLYKMLSIGVLRISELGESVDPVVSRVYRESNGEDNAEFAKMGRLG